MTAGVNPATADSEATGAVPAHRIPSLDGLRAVSIIAVMLGHLHATRGFPAALSRVIGTQVVDVANLGVRVFFVISGFLITGLLIDEHRRYGSISLRRFYLRRTLRIFPAYYAFIAVLAGAVALGILTATPADFAHALTYTLNYVPDRSWNVGHLWSLAVEEQFYLLWPATVALLGLRRGAVAALGAVALVPVIRVAESTLLAETRPLIGTSFETAADALAIGCLLALARDRLWARGWVRRAVSSRWVIPIIFAIGVAASQRWRPALLIGIPIVNLAIALTVERCVRRPNGLVGRMLNAPALVFIGTLSYSIYLWQQLFLNRYSTSPATAFPLNVVLAACAALASYYLVERPVLRSRPRVERRVFSDVRRARPDAARASQQGGPRSDTPSADGDARGGLLTAVKRRG